MRPHATRRRRGESRPGRARGPAFTLIELLIVVLIIGIIVSLILTAAMDGIRRSEERATQALVTKVDAGMNDRLEALLNEHADANSAHFYLGALWNSSAGIVSQKTLPQTIAQVERIKAELPDGFAVQLGTNLANTPYPLNFAAMPYPGTAASVVAPAAVANSLLPMGCGVYNDPANSSYGDYPLTGPQSVVAPVSYGVYGVSYSALAGFNKQLSEAAIAYLQSPAYQKTGGAAYLGPPNPPSAGYDGIDNNGDGLIDELAEQDFGQPSGSAKISDAIRLYLLPKHQHKTARGASLYAILVEGQGPLGSVFSKDDFSDKEVRDTDGDGLLEFVDAWGEPLQWYRWPIGHESDVQIGLQPLIDGTVPRPQNPLDPNQQLVNPAWWSKGYNNNGPFASMPGQPPLSSGAAYFHQSFFSLVDPNYNAYATTTPGRLWGRGDARRAYYSRYLILSGGSDKLPGVPVLDATYWSNLGVAGPTSLTQALLQVESQAAPHTPVRSDIYFLTPDATSEAAMQPLLHDVAGDDITNQNIHGPGGATQ